MIELKDITRRYGSVEAVSHLSFTAPDKQITGLLGQNGAGKTTTLNMITGYLPPSSGQILINGLDMLTQSRDCKRLIGYLPERPPLYDEMTVTDYLAFVCRLREVRSQVIKKHTDNIMELCGLTEVRNRRLGSLSKGYRQRSGFAQALCGDPPVLVLDEPTVGLDPRQVVEIRDLMRTIGKDHTVIFSSHILSEIQQLCSHAIILHHGKLIKDADLNALGGGSGIMKLRLTALIREQKLLPAVRSLPCIRRAEARIADQPGACCL